MKFLNNKLSRINFLILLRGCLMAVILPITVQIMKLIMMTETDLNEIGENSFKFAANNYDTKAMYKNAISPLLNTL